METHSNVLARRIPGTGEPGQLPSMGSHRVGHDWSDLAAAAAMGVMHRVEVMLKPMMTINMPWNPLLFQPLWGPWQKSTCAHVWENSKTKKFNEMWWLPLGPRKGMFASSLGGRSVRSGFWSNHYTSVGSEGSSSMDRWGGNWGAKGALCKVAKQDPAGLEGRGFLLSPLVPPLMLPGPEVPDTHRVDRYVGRQMLDRLTIDR